MAHLAHPFFELKVLVLLNNSCAKPFGTLGTNGDFIDFFALLPWHTFCTVLSHPSKKLVKCT